MALVGFALLAAHQDGATLAQLADRLNLPLEWVCERVEAARLCLLLETQIAA
jgi:hypothetical protein